MYGLGRSAGKRFRRRDGCHDISGQATVSVDPGEEPLTDPAPCMHDEPDVPLHLADDLDPNRTGHRWALIAPIHIGRSHEWPARARGPQQAVSAIAVLNVRRGGVPLESPAIGVDVA